MTKGQLIASRLKEVVLLLEQVLEQLDVLKEPCSACGLGKCRNWEEAQDAKQIKSVIGKLRLMRDSHYGNTQTTKESDK